MKRLAFSSLPLLALASPLFGGEAPAPRRPNIVLILADDMGFSDLGCYGSEIQTPNLDRLAERGLRFSQFYNCARCCPTRASLLTGLYPHQAGVGHMVEDRGLPGYRGRLNDRCLTIAEALPGYRTVMSGKWHLGEDRPHWPVERGFEEYFGLLSGASSYFKLDPDRAMAWNREPYLPPEDGFYMTRAITDHAVRAIGESGRQEKAREARPFFLYLAYTAPHWPLHALREDIERCRGRYREGWDAVRRRRVERLAGLGLFDRAVTLPPRDKQAPPFEEARDREALELRMAVYAAQIERMDREIGRVLDKLEEVGARDHTLVMFLSDNGGCAEVVDKMKNGAPAGSPESYLSYGLAWANVSNTPFRLYKHWVHEGGIATPFIASWPEAIRSRGSITREVGHVIDVLPTCLEAAGLPYPPSYRGKDTTPLPGKSLLPIFQGKTRPGHEALFWEHEGNRAVRQGKWKLVARGGGAAWELYDLEADRTELCDLAREHPSRVHELEALYQAWADRSGVLPWKRVRKMRRF